ncbi:MAG TPA: DinB family protein [Terriglobales bacterium]|nr:DinB family protein [Terriglobales bacterium]
MSADVRVSNVSPAIGRPDKTEAAPYYFTYIDKVPGEDIVPFLSEQLETAGSLLASIGEEKSLFRYGPGKWSIREVLNHLNDTERVFAVRALWFARGYETPLASFDQEIAIAHSKADTVSWAAQVEEFRRIRLASISLFENLPAEAWMRAGIASENKVTVRALAYIIAGHVEHHLRILKERYLK